MAAVNPVYKENTILAVFWIVQRGNLALRKQSSVVCSVWLMTRGRVLSLNEVGQENPKSVWCRKKEGGFNKSTRVLENLGRKEASRSNKDSETFGEALLLPNTLRGGKTRGSMRRHKRG